MCWHPPVITLFCPFDALDSPLPLLYFLLYLLLSLLCLQLIGPVIGPLIGSAVSHRFGWRACFVLLAVYAAMVLLLAVVMLHKETHQVLGA